VQKFAKLKSETATKVYDISGWPFANCYLAVVFGALKRNIICPLGKHDAPYVPSSDEDYSMEHLSVPLRYQDKWLGIGTSL
jgi:hypothetical protein